MAKTVSDIFLRLKLDGKEQLEKLKGSFRGLEKTIGITDSALEQIRSELVAYNREGGASIAVLKGQISALSDLQKQATAGGKVFRQLSRDVEAFERRLRQAEAQANATERAVSFRATQGRFVSRTPGGLFGKVAALQQAPQEERFLEGKGINPEYIKQQGELKVLTEAQARIEARLQNAINATTRAKVDNNNESLTAAQITEQYSRGISTSANTTAQLAQRVRELRSDLRDLTFGSREYGQVLAQINRLETEIADPFGTAARKEQIRGRLGTQEQFGMYAGTDPVAKSIRRQREKQARQAAPRQVPTQTRQISGLYQQIGGIGLQRVRADIELMGNSYQQVARDIKAATAASNGSINSLQSQRGAWATLRANLDPAGKSYREVSKEIERLDRRLAKLNSTQKLGARLRQNVGAAAAGAVFGGPEAAIGGLVGGLGGAAIGAQVGMMRESLSATADYATEINKLRMALEGVTKTADQNQQALEAINDVVRDFNVPQEVATKGMTRLSAAVLGAGGNVSDAELVFKNITASIKATGGSADDVNSAITAMVQVFSKGKVSAEELSGQLGERLPGAVTKFAEANFEGDMIALQKALKDGTVGLNELMKFIIELGEEYSGVAKSIAQSSLDAGARAQVAWNQVRITVGESIQPIGAELQAAFGEFALETLPAVTAGAEIAAKGMNFLLDAASFLIKNFKELLLVAGAAGVALALQNLIAIATSLGTAVGALQVSFAALNATMLLNPWVALAAGIAALSVALYKAATASDAFNKAVAAGKVSTTEANSRLSELNLKIDQLQTRLATESNGRLLNSLRRQLRQAKQEAKDLELAIKLATPYTVSGISYDPSTGRAINPPPTVSDLTTFPTLTGDKDGSGKDGSGKEKKLMSKEEADLRIKITSLREKEQLIAAVQAQYDLDILVANQETEDLQKKRVMMAEAEEKARKSIFSLFKGITDEYLKQNKQGQDLNRELEDRKYQLGLITEEQYNQYKIERERKRLEEAYPGEGFAGKRAEAEDLYRREVDPTFKEGAQTEVKKMEEGLEKMTKPLEQLKGAAMAFGESISQAFSNIVTGSQTAQQAMASFLKNLGQYFVEYAAKVITQMIAIATIQAVIKALGGPSTGGGDAGASSTPDISGFSSYDISNTPTLASFGNAQGNAFNKGLKRYAMGGVVNKPTMFTYAEGGTGRFGLMGEAGPEAIIPLKRGNDGRLGVSAYFADANAAMAKGAANRSSSAEAFDENADALAMSSSYVRERSQERERQTMLTGAGGSMLIQTEVINNVEYATMDQVAQATAASAKQARAQVFADMRNKPATRSSLGMR